MMTLPDARYVAEGVLVQIDLDTIPFPFLKNPTSRTSTHVIVVSKLEKFSLSEDMTAQQLSVLNIKGDVRGLVACTAASPDNTCRNFQPP